LENGYAFLAVIYKVCMDNRKGKRKKDDTIHKITSIKTADASLSVTMK
jgi:hypothetical protein